MLQDLAVTLAGKLRTAFHRHPPNALARRHFAQAATRRPTQRPRPCKPPAHMQEARPQVGDRVSFRFSDVFLAAPEEPLSPDHEMEGTVIDFSDSGNEPRWFAVVEVVRRQTFVVPVSELRVHKAG